MLIENKFHTLLAKYLGKGSGYHHAIPSQYDVLKNSLLFVEALLDDTPLTFIDLGSGLGNVLHAANEILGNNDYIGIDHNPNYIKIAQAMMPDMTFVEDDLFSTKTLDCIKNADVIYIYRPFLKEEEEETMYRLLEDNMKAGAYLMCNDLGYDPNFTTFDTIKEFIYSCGECPTTEGANLTLFQKQ